MMEITREDILQQIKQCPDTLEQYETAYEWAKNCIDGFREAADVGETDFDRFDLLLYSESARRSDQSSKLHRKYLSKCHIQKPAAKTYFGNQEPNRLFGDMITGWFHSGFSGKSAREEVGGSFDSIAPMIIEALCVAQNGSLDDNDTRQALEAVASKWPEHFGTGNKTYGSQCSEWLHLANPERFPVLGITLSGKRILSAYHILGWIESKDRLQDIGYLLDNLDRIAAEKAKDADFNELEYWQIDWAFRQLVDKEGHVMKQNELVSQYREIVERNRNVIFHGAPGTGKTYLAKQIAAEIIDVDFDPDNDEDKLGDKAEGRFGFVQFHPSYDYTDFVEGLRPASREDGQVGFELIDGIFKQFVKPAKDSSDDYVFVIDEINRGDISKIFGEMFFAIDPEYRGKKGEVQLQYANMHPDEEKKKFYIPENVYIIGTMNDIDRSVDSFDYAMRRRFKFVEIEPEKNDSWLDDFENGGDARARMKALNDLIAGKEGVGKRYQLGASYFKAYAQGDEDADELWEHSLEPLIKEYLHDAGISEDEIEKYKVAFNSPDKKTSGSETGDDTEEEKLA